MKKIDLGQTITILANLGVIAGILFLGYELRQNNRFLEQQEQHTFLENNVNFLQFIAANEDVAGLVFRLPDGSILPEAELEQNRRCAVMSSMFRSWHWDFENLEISPADQLAQVYREFWRRTLPDDCWARDKNGYPSDFVQFIDENVIE